MALGSNHPHRPAGSRSSGPALAAAWLPPCDGGKTAGSNEEFQKAWSMPRSKWNNAPRARRGQFDQKREDILRVAARIFCEQGFDKTTVDDIAAALNVTKPTIYYYWGNKDVILEEIRKSLFETINQGLEQARSEGRTGREQLSLLIDTYVDSVTGDFGRCVMLNENRLRTSKPANKSGFPKKFNADVEKVIAEGQADGSISDEDAHMMAYVLFGALNWIAFWYRSNARYSAPQIAKHFKRILMTGFEPRSPKPRSAGSHARRKTKAAAKSTA